MLGMAGVTAMDVSRGSMVIVPTLVIWPVTMETLVTEP